MSFNLLVDDHEVMAVLARITAQYSPAGMAPAMKEIGEALLESTKQRFSTGTAPDGSRWAALKEGTVLARLARISGAYGKKTGQLTKKGAAVAMGGMKPLVETGILQEQIRYQVSDDGAGVHIGSNRFAGEWNGGAAVHQFGDRRGHIPARPFLGLSAGDRGEVLDILNQMLK